MAHLLLFRPRLGKAVKFQVGLTIMVFMTVLACQSTNAQVVVPLNLQAASGQSGTAIMTAEGNRTRVVLEVTPIRLEDELQPVHIHFGTCGANLGSVHYPLEDVLQGRSETLVEALITSLQDGNHAINLHKSLDEISVYTACGSISQ